MTRALAVAALIGCACGQSSSNAPVSTCPASPAVPTVDLALCPVERSEPPLVVTEPVDDSVLVRGHGFWCTDYVAGKWSGLSDCFRLQESCDMLRQQFRKIHKTTECRPVERASCLRVIDHKLMRLAYLCVLPAQCEARRRALLSSRPDRVVSECRELN